MEGARWREDYGYGVMVSVDIWCQCHCLVEAGSFTSSILMNATPHLVTGSLPKGLPGCILGSWDLDLLTPNPKTSLHLGSCSKPGARTTQRVCADQMQAEGQQRNGRKIDM